MTHRVWARKRAWRKRILLAFAGLILSLPLAILIDPLWMLVSLLGFFYLSRREEQSVLAEIDQKYGLAYRSALQAGAHHPWKDHLEAEARASLSRAKPPRFPLLEAALYLAFALLVLLLPPINFAPGLTSMGNPVAGKESSAEAERVAAKDASSPAKPEGQTEPVSEPSASKTGDQLGPGGADRKEPQDLADSKEQAGGTKTPAGSGKQAAKTDSSGQSGSKESQGVSPSSDQRPAGDQPSSGNQQGAAQPDRAAQAGSKSEPGSSGPGAEAVKQGQGAPASTPQQGGSQGSEGINSAGSARSPLSQNGNAQEAVAPPSTQPGSRKEAVLPRGTSRGSLSLPSPWKGGKPPASVLRRAERYLETEPLSPEVRELLRRYFELSKK